MGADEISGLGAGLSGFAQGFAASFRDRKEREYEQKLEERKNSREFFIKGALDPSNPADPNDPAIMREAENLFGKEHVPMFQALLTKSNKHVAEVKAAQAAARTEPLSPGEKRTVTDKGLGVSETRMGPKPTDSLSDVEAKAAARARGTESVTGPAKEKRAQAADQRKQAGEDRAARRQRIRDVQAERRQFRTDVRKTAMKLRSDPSTRNVAKRLMDWVTGSKPDQRLSEALSGIPPEALPPSLQQQQQPTTPAAGGTPPPAAAGGTTQSGRVKWSPVATAQ